MARTYRKHKKVKLSGNPVYTAEDCIALRDNDKLQGKVLVLTTGFFYDEYKHPEYQLVYCEYGYSNNFCCRFLIDNEFSVFNRADFIGEIKPADLPEWAQERLITILNKQINGKRKLARVRSMLEKRLETAAEKSADGGRRV